ncbi:MAG: D-alanyl-D-alanine carboxypeptidase family protein [Coriobacteriia bacterium]|nr:D-alanyl-D-alanine carboxypeptidase family protein [Coriobacteriia bacterium]
MLRLPLPVCESEGLSNVCPYSSKAQLFRPVARCLALALAFSLIVPTPGVAVVLPSDRVDGQTRTELGLPKAALPDVTMAAGILATDDGRVLWARRAADRRAIASITKVMTAIVVMEETAPDELITIPRSSTRVGESTAFLREGEKLPVSEVLEALLVKSGNDAAVALAAHVAGGEEPFVDLMNAKARELGLKRTHFKNPHGLDEEGGYASASDVVVMTRYAMTKPLFRRIVAQKTAVIGSGARAEKVLSTNLLIGNYAGANGIKTGWTSDAGYSVVVSAARDGVELQAVVLGTTNELRRFRDAREMLDFGFAHYRPQKLVSAGSVIGEAAVTDYLDVTVPAAVSEDVTVTVFDLAGPITREVTTPDVAAPVRAGQRIGVATFTQGDEVVATIPLVAAADVERPGPLERIGIALTRAWRKLSGAPE